MLLIPFHENSEFLLRILTYYGGYSKFTSNKLKHQKTRKKCVVFAHKRKLNLAGRVIINIHIYEHLRTIHFMIGLGAIKTHIEH